MMEVFKDLIDKLHSECTLVAIGFGILFVLVVKMAFSFAATISRQQQELHRARKED